MKIVCRKNGTIATIETRPVVNRRNEFDQIDQTTVGQRRAIGETQEIVHQEIVRGLHAGTSVIIVIGTKSKTNKMFPFLRIDKSDD